MRYLGLFFLFAALGQGLWSADSEEEDKARAALALAKARAKAVKPTEVKPAMPRACFEDLDECRAAAKREGKQYVIWVGVQCCDHPEVRAVLGDRLHCHAAELHGDKAPRLVLNGHDGEVYRVPLKQMTPEYVRSIITPPASTGREARLPSQADGRAVVGAPARWMPPVVCRS